MNTIGCIELEVANSRKITLVTYHFCIIGDISVAA